MHERRYDIDWLRVGAMGIVFLFHCTRFFCDEGWHLKVPPAEQSELLTILRDMLVGVWQMELFFLVAGFATWYALARRSAGQYLRDRAKRLLVPLYTVGLFVLLPPQAYFEAVTNTGLWERFTAWLPRHYLGLPGQMLRWWEPWIDPASLLPYPFTGHLWFIRTLFVLSLLTLPLLLWLRGPRGQAFIARAAAWVARPGGPFLFLVPLFIVQVALRWPPAQADRGWGDFMWYAAYFLIGYLLAADARFLESIQRRLWVWLPLWIGSYLLTGGGLKFGLGYEPVPNQGFSALYVLFVAGWCVISWSAVATMLSLGARYLTRSTPLLAYANEAVLPFYLLHQTVILIVGWYVLPLPITNLARFLLIALLSFPLILALYELLVRRSAGLRFLFGMNPPRREAAAPRPTPDLRPGPLGRP